MIIAPVPFHTISTPELVQLTWGLDAFLDGRLEEGTADHVEFLPAEVLARAQAEIGHLELPDLLTEVAFELSRREPLIGASLAAWHSWNHRSMSWGQAMLSGAEAAAQEAQ